ncbi:MAG: hypothetical protein RLZZ546_2097 [Bacteroidota bacterium]
MRFLVLFFLSIVFFGLHAQNLGIISGTIIDLTDQRPIEFASVILEGTEYGATTDSNGIFKIQGIVPKSYNVSISYLGYNTKKLFNVVITSGNEYTINAELAPSSEDLGELVIKARLRTVNASSVETPLSIQKLTLEEIKSNPGGNFDISKVIQVLPGVGGGVGGGGFRNDIIVRGGAPNENVFYLDGIEIPVINHFQTQGSSGGPQGMLNVSFIEDVKLSSSAFDAKYDNAMSSVFQFKQKNGNANQVQGNVRLSASELATTLEGPLSKGGKTTFLASARRSYLQLLFSLIDLPIRPNYWDFQAKVSTKIDKNTTLSFIGLGAIDEFSFAKIKNSTPEKQYIFDSNPIINQWNYTAGVSLKKLLKNGYYNVAVSRNVFNNDLKRYEDNETKLPSEIALDINSTETENKIRFDITKNLNVWKISYGVSAQFVEYDTKTLNVIRKEIKDVNGNILQPGIIVNGASPLENLMKYGAFGQISRRVLNQKLGISAGIRSDMNSFTSSGMNPINTLSPRLSLSYLLTEKLTANASVGRYFKLAPYTILGFSDSAGNLLNKDVDYLKGDHFTGGFEFLPSDELRFTAEAFYKNYGQVPISVLDGISLSNLGSDFNVLGNEAVTTTGKGRAYGFEFFAQKKLSSKFFGVFSYTFYKSEYSGSDGKLVASSWDNRHLVSVVWGYKLPRNWELGLKFRFQGGAAFTPLDERASRLNYLSFGRGILDYSRLNTERLASFNSSDIRIDKKWNFKATTLDFFIDVTNWYGSKNIQPDDYTFKRNAENTGFETTDGAPIKQDGSNAIPIKLNNATAQVTPTIGLIVEF